MNGLKADTLETDEIWRVMCPRCRSVLNELMSVDDAEKPREDDIVVCHTCATLLRIDADLRLEEASAEFLSRVEAEYPWVIRHLKHLQQEIQEDMKDVLRVN